MGTRSLLQGIFPTEGSKPGLPHCRRILYQLSHKGSPRVLERVAYPFLSGSPQPRNRAGASCIQADSLPAELSGLYRRACLAHTLPPRFSSECQEGSERGPARVSPSDTQQSAVSPCTSTRPSCLSAAQSGGAYAGCRAAASPTQPSTTPPDSTVITRLTLAVTEDLLA